MRSLELTLALCGLGVTKCDVETSAEGCDEATGFCVESGRCPAPGSGSTTPGCDGGVSSEANVPWRFDGGGVNPPG